MPDTPSPTPGTEELGAQVQTLLSEATAAVGHARTKVATAFVAAPKFGSSTHAAVTPATERSVATAGLGSQVDALLQNAGNTPADSGEGVKSGLGAPDVPPPPIDSGSADPGGTDVANIGSLDTELAALTESLLSDEPAGDPGHDDGLPVENVASVSMAADASPVAAVSAAPALPQPPTSAVGPERPQTAAAVPAVARPDGANQATILRGSAHAEFAERLRAALAAAAPAVVAVLAVLSKPVLGKSKSVRDTLGWAALVTLLNASVLWFFVLMVYKPGAVDGHGGGAAILGPHDDPAPHDEHASGGAPAHAPAKKAAHGDEQQGSDHGAAEKKPAHCSAKETKSHAPAKESHSATSRTGTGGAAAKEATRKRAEGAKSSHGKPGSSTKKEKSGGH